MSKRKSKAEKSIISAVRELPFEALIAPAFLEVIPDATVAVDEHGKILQINPQTEELFGYTREELLGQGVELLVPDRHRDRHHRHRADFVAQPKVRRMGAGLELFGRKKDGTEFPVEISLSPVKTEKGFVVLSAIRDVSDRRRIESELRKAHEELQQWADRELWTSRERLGLIVDSSDDAIIGKDLDGVITSWNKGAERIYGYPAEEAIGNSISALIAPDDRRDEIPEILRKIRRGERVEHFETVRKTKDGRRLNVSITVSPIRDNASKILGASVIARNITDQKRAEMQLRQAQKMEAVGRLAGGVAHDFNNVLSIITACTDLLRSRVPKENQEFVDNIKTAAQRGATLTRQLLTFSRKHTFQTTVFDANTRLDEINRLLKPLMGDDVEITLQRHAPEALIEADPIQFDHVLFNLAVNSRDAMPHGGKFILETNLAEFDAHFVKQHPQVLPGKYVLVAVSDTGMGMDEETVSHIFEPFFTTKDVGKGTGLGLATVYGVVRQSGGYVWVYSEPGRGTTFKIYFPNASKKLEEAAEAPAQVSVAHSTATILLVEDDNLMRSLTRRMLEENGYQVVEAPDGASALEAVAEFQGKIDLMISDVVMRGMSGPELGIKLSKLHPEMKIVYMSGYTGELISRKDPLQPDVILLEKPFTQVSLLKVIAETLE